MDVAPRYGVVGLRKTRKQSRASAHQDYTPRETQAVSPLAKFRGVPISFGDFPSPSPALRRKRLAQAAGTQRRVVYNQP